MTMTTITVTALSKNITLEKAWEFLTDIEKYPQRVKYLKKVKIYGTGKGSRWDDITTILWIPLKMRHTVTAYEKYHHYCFELPLFFGGTMKQEYLLSEKNRNDTIIKSTITYDLGNKFLNNTIGTILKYRLKKMLESSIKNTGAEIQ